MHFEPITYPDLEEIKRLQPGDWSDIIPHLKFYIDADFCHPVKAIYDQRIVGIGASIVFQNTSWLGHIIVDAGYRNQGIGYQLVKKLIDNPDFKPANPVLLTATKLGEPVYKKIGFRPVTDYVFFNRTEAWTPCPVSKHIIPYEKAFRSGILAMDERVTGEDRQRVLTPHLNSALLYVADNILQGFYMPDLGEGPIIAETKEAGIDLMKIKYDHVDKAVLPAENAIAIDFLKENGFAETSKGLRMILGNDFNWQPASIYSRIGGNIG